MSVRARRGWAGLLGAGVLVALVLLPGVAWACPMCLKAASEESRIAFIATTGFMTAMPLLVVGGAIWWVRRRFLAAEAEAEQGGRPAESRGSLPDGSPQGL